MNKHTVVISVLLQSSLHFVVVCGTVMLDVSMGFSVDNSFNYSTHMYLYKWTVE